MSNVQTAPAVRAPLFTNRELVRLLWPLVIEQTLAMLVGMSDTVMVSSVGEAAISGVSLVDMINNLIINVFAALATGGAVVTSQVRGARRPAESDALCRARAPRNLLVTTAPPVASAASS